MGPVGTVRGRRAACPYLRVLTWTLTWECSDRLKGNGYKLKENRYRLDSKKKFFTVRVVSCWNSFLEKLWMPHPKECSQPGLVGQSDLAECLPMSRGWEPDFWSVTFQTIL